MARLSRGEMLQSRDNKIAELNKDPDQTLKKYSDNFVESADTIFHYAVVNVDFNTTAFAGFDIVDAKPILEKAKMEMEFIKRAENINTEKVEKKEEPQAPEPAKVSGSEITGKTNVQNSAVMSTSGTPQIASEPGKVTPLESPSSQQNDDSERQNSPETPKSDEKDGFPGDAPKEENKK